MYKKWITYLFLIGFLGLSHSPVFASLLPVPGATPSLTPKVIVIKDKKILQVKKGKKIVNTPAIEWKMIKKWKAIEVFENSESQVFVQKIDLSSGATIATVFEFNSYDASSGEPLYTRFSPRDEIKSLSKRPSTYINGQFFDPKRTYTPFSFGFKLQNTVLTAGADNRGEAKNIFSYSNGLARIIPYSWEAFRAEKADFALVNLSVANNQADDNKYMGRTYICIVQPDALGYSKTLMTFSFLQATDAYAQEIVSSWWCEPKYTSKLDSSGSSVFGIGNTHYAGYSPRGKPDYRKIPQIITFYDE